EDKSKPSGGRLLGTTKSFSNKELDKNQYYSVSILEEIGRSNLESIGRYKINPYNSLVFSVGGMNKSAAIINGRYANNDNYNETANLRITHNYSVAYLRKVSEFSNLSVGVEVGMYNKANTTIARDSISQSIVNTKTSYTPQQTTSRNVPVATTINKLKPQNTQDVKVMLYKQYLMKNIDSLNKEDAKILEDISLAVINKANLQNANLQTANPTATNVNADKNARIDVNNNYNICSHMTSTQYPEICRSGNATVCDMFTYLADKNPGGMSGIKCDSNGHMNDTQICKVTIASQFCDNGVLNEGKFCSYYYNVFFTGGDLTIEEFCKLLDNTFVPPNPPPSCSNDVSLCDTNMPPVNPECNINDPLSCIVADPAPMPEVDPECDVNDPLACIVAEPAPMPTPDPTCDIDDPLSCIVVEPEPMPTPDANDTCLEDPSLCQVPGGPGGDIVDPNNPLTPPPSCEDDNSCGFPPAPPINPKPTCQTDITLCNTDTMPNIDPECDINDGVSCIIAEPAPMPTPDPTCDINDPISCIVVEPEPMPNVDTCIDLNGDEICQIPDIELPDIPNTCEGFIDLCNTPELGIDPPEDCLTDTSLCQIPNIDLPTVPTCDSDINLCIPYPMPEIDPECDVNDAVSCIVVEPSPMPTPDPTCDINDPVSCSLPENCLTNPSLCQVPGGPGGDIVDPNNPLTPPPSCEDDNSCGFPPAPPINPKPTCQTDITLCNTDTMPNVNPECDINDVSCIIAEPSPMPTPDPTCDVNDPLSCMVIEPAPMPNVDANDICEDKVDSCETPDMGMPIIESCENDQKFCEKPDISNPTVIKPRPPVVSMSSNSYNAMFLVNYELLKVNNIGLAIEGGIGAMYRDIKIRGAVSGSGSTMALSGKVGTIGSYYLSDNIALGVGVHYVYTGGMKFKEIGKTDKFSGYSFNIQNERTTVYSLQLRFLF
ncbi:MAG: hypothetical protein LBQ34_02075, partial [Alphaproteobacteria bacterium]|nr:hypothetical protein [Alphaproteobacteria bacterium]